MCYYNGTKVTRQEFIRLKQLEKLVANYTFLDDPLHNGFEYRNVPVLRKTEGSHDFEIVAIEWGFIPDASRWPYIETRDQVKKFREGYTDERGKYHKAYITLNAVSEELLLKDKWFREAACKRRCLAISTGFYDYRHINKIGKKGQLLKATDTFPYRVTIKETEIFYMAGIWQPWTDAETGEYVETLAIITTVANSLMEQIHNQKKRMPTILNEDLAHEWLFEDLTEKRITEIARFQIPSTSMEAYTVDKQFRTAEDPSKPHNYIGVPALIY